MHTLHWRKYHGKAYSDISLVMFMEFMCPPNPINSPGLLCYVLYYGLHFQ